MQNCYGETGPRRPERRRHHEPRNHRNPQVETEGFAIDSDQKAEWALRKIREHKADANRMAMVCNAEIERYEQIKRTPPTSAPAIAPISNHCFMPTLSPSLTRPRKRRRATSCPRARSSRNSANRNTSGLTLKSSRGSTSKESATTPRSSPRSNGPISKRLSRQTGKRPSTPKRARSSPA